jgi:hypothetical protein
VAMLDSASGPRNRMRHARCAAAINWAVEEVKNARVQYFYATVGGMGNCCVDD